MTTNGSTPALLGNRLAPITQAIGFLESPFATVVEADRAWKQEIGRSKHSSVTGPLDRLLDSLPPMTGPLIRQLWVSTRGGRWTAYFDNSRNGGDPYTIIAYLSGRLHCRGVAVEWMAQTKGAYGAARFDVYGQAPTDALNNTRTVAAISDGGRWVWNAIGEVQPFEEPERYAASRIRDRLTPDMLDRYCSALGIALFDEAFYGPEGHLVENRNVRCTPLSESLSGAQARLGIKWG